MSLLEQSESAHSEFPSMDSQEVQNPPKHEHNDELGRPYHLVERGIYQHRENKNYFERPWINGKRTWRKLAGKNLKLSREEYYRRRASVAKRDNPYGEAESVEPSPQETAQPRPEPASAPRAESQPGHVSPAEPDSKSSRRSRKRKQESEARMVGEVIRRYQDDGYLDRHLLTRPMATQESEARHCKILLEFWEFVEVAEVADMICDEYRDWRIERVQRGEGLRTIDRELNTLNNAFRYGKRRGLVKVNAMADRPKYQLSSRVRHCREFMPTDANDLHDPAIEMAENRHSQVLLFQALAEAYSGLRTCEVLKWKANAKPGGSAT